MVFNLKIGDKLLLLIRKIGDEFEARTPKKKFIFIAIN